MSNNEGPSVLEESGQSAALRPASKPYWVGLLVVAMGAIWLYGAAGLPQGARYAAVGPGLFVTISGLGLVILGILLMAQIWRGERFEPQDTEDAAANSPMDVRAFSTALAAVVLPVFTMRPLGLPLTGTIAFVLVCMALGSRKIPMDVVIGAALASVSWYIFTQLGLQLGPFFPPLGL